MPAGSASKSTEFPYGLKIEVDKAPRPKDPKQVRREQLDRMLRKGSITKAEHERMVRSIDE